MDNLRINHILFPNQDCWENQRYIEEKQLNLSDIMELFEFPYHLSDGLSYLTQW